MEEVLIILRNMSDDDFLQAVRARLMTRPLALIDLWQALDPAPFEKLVDNQDLRGPTLRAFRALSWEPSPAA